MNSVVSGMVAKDPELSTVYGLTTGSVTGPITNTSITTGDCTWHPYQYTYGVVSYDKTKRAFSVAKKLIKSKLVSAKTIDQFVALVELIEAEL